MSRMNSQRIYLIINRIKFKKTTSYVSETSYEWEILKDKIWQRNPVILFDSKLLCGNATQLALLTLLLLKMYGNGLWLTINHKLLP